MCREHCRAKAGGFVAGCHPELRPQDIGFDLLPQRAARSATRGSDLLRRTRWTDDANVLRQRMCDAQENRADDLATTMRRRDAREAGFDPTHAIVWINDQPVGVGAFFGSLFEQ